MKLGIKKIKGLTSKKTLKKNEKKLAKTKRWGIII
jgi:hypothetical protein